MPHQVEILSDLPDPQVIRVRGTSAERSACRAREDRGLEEGWGSVMDDGRFRRKVSHGSTVARLGDLWRVTWAKQASRRARTFHAFHVVRFDLPSSHIQPFGIRRATMQGSLERTSKNHVDIVSETSWKSWWTPRRDRCVQKKDDSMGPCIPQGTVKGTQRMCFLTLD